jgi:hypothetical protein
MPAFGASQPSRQAAPLNPAAAAYSPAAAAKKSLNPTAQTFTPKAAGPAAAAPPPQPPVAAEPPAPPPPPPLPPAFARSKLAVPAAAAPAKDVKLNGAWTLYADEAATTAPVLGGEAAPAVSLPFEPIKVATVGTVERFWRLWRSVPAASTRATGFTYFFFRNDIQPTWEDPRNRSGGTVMFQLTRPGASAVERDAADDAWLTTLLALVGESLPLAQSINGAVLKVRKSITVTLWTARADKPAFKATFERLRQLIVPSLLPVSFMDSCDLAAHKDAAAPATPAAPTAHAGTLKASTPSSPVTGTPSTGMTPMRHGGGGMTRIASSGTFPSHHHTHHHAGAMQQHIAAAVVGRAGAQLPPPLPPPPVPLSGGAFAASSPPPYSGAALPPQSPSSSQPRGQPGPSRGGRGKVSSPNSP